MIYTDIQWQLSLTSLIFITNLLIKPNPEQWN